jgi:hypothetical protein
VLLRRLLPFAVLAAVPVAVPASAGEPTTFPLPVVAPVMAPEDVAPELAVSSYGVTTDGETLEVRFADSFDLPEVPLYRVALLVGEPGETRTRVALVVEDGEVAGSVAESDGGEFAEVDTTEVSYEDGVARIALPDGLDADAAAAWLDVSIVEEAGGEAERFVSPIVPAHDLLTPSGPATTSATVAWSSNGQPPGEAIDVGTGPVLTIDGDELVVEYVEPTPTEVDGLAVEGVTDVIRVAPSFDDVSAAPDLIVIDHAVNTVSLLDGTTPIPAEIPNDPDSWLELGLPTREIIEGDLVRISLPGVLRVFGVDADDIDQDDRLGFGIARSVRVDDGTDAGVVYRADGVTATAQWFSTQESTTGTTDGDEAAAAAGSGSDDDEKMQTVIVIGAVIVLLGTVAFLVIRWLEHRRHAHIAAIAGGRPAPAKPPTAEERERLDEFTRQLFDGKR